MTESLTTTTSAAPAARPSRLVALDVLRGIAILGTLGTNIWILTDPEGIIGYINHLGAPVEDGWGWAERALQQFAQGKYLGLLTIMFGIGLAIQQASAQRAGRRWPGKYPIRAGLLLLDGLLNFLLIAEFDVLMGYALTGLVVAYLLATSERAQRRWLIVQASIHVTMLTLLAVAMTADGGSVSDSDPEPLDPNPYADGSFWDLVLFRLDNALTFRVEAIFIFPMSIALFLLGARLYRAGVFAPEGARLRKRLMILGFGVAAPADLLLGVFVGGDVVLITRYGIAPLVSLGILALVAHFYLNRPGTGFVGARLSEVGRTALSCYILQNLVASIICYGWGFGVAARVSPDARVPFTVAVYLVVALIIIGFAHLWLRRFDRGPVEWAWHATYRRLAGE
ncbi:DUF418 domain-containing protein [Nocardia cyriacigeorgica]|uniref:Predicted membrane protein n=1 Tax=Nocardia cyriacigeorgica TaxID=135487 RepID=A0A4U8VX55_9NOCA|nr:DUF418 domain-containing protein [Nocardia cyriacigeorgica]MBF6162681.1 DUF418 domain-containing protein [Nocardia cyriacigeorgica]MBF6198139.1 DUF418 domain-containing protein [Nocardia cyriacigeorgica]MBF6317002.1 DUF418 domain-containing protein [Nocardia cyriacigeorgica]MBF6347134.1 DUF418 domain-containing protein [Nocardia cyriacigeorgica]MBF6532446.1 DUF418 domain-containing protein [Nocardia cyriacigeorgica]